MINNNEIRIQGNGLVVYVCMTSDQLVNNTCGKHNFKKGEICNHVLYCLEKLKITTIIK